MKKKIRSNNVKYRPFFFVKTKQEIYPAPAKFSHITTYTRIMMVTYFYLYNIIKTFFLGFCIIKFVLFLSNMSIIQCLIFMSILFKEVFDSSFSSMVQRFTDNACCVQPYLQQIMQKYERTHVLALYAPLHTHKIASIPWMVVTSP